jgi:D-threo-aldose 1-dehydrogenase
MTPALRTALAQGPLALGGAPLGNLYRPLSDADAIALVRHAYASGIRYFDTAPHYGNGLSERRFGAVLSTLPRDAFVLSTKVGRLLRRDRAAPSAQHGYVDVPPLVQTYDYTRDGLLRSLDDSRRRLRVDRVDLVYVHDLDRATHGPRFEAHFRALLDSGLPALAELKAAGVIGGYGIGVNGVAICLETLRHADLDIILLAGRYTLADQSALPDLLPECMRRDVTVVVGGAFNSGILATGSRPAAGTRPYFDYASAPDAMVAHVAALEAVCARHGVALPAAALQFPAAHPVVSAVLAGARSVPELEQCLAWSKWPIPAEFWVELRERGLLAAAAPLPNQK